MEVSLQLMNERSLLLRRDSIMSSLDPRVLQKQDPGREEELASSSDSFKMLSIIFAAHLDAVMSSNMAVK